MAEFVPEALGDVCEQAHFLRVNPYAAAPERRFMLALLEHALNDLKFPETAPDALRWFEDTGSYLPDGISLSDACEVLNIEPTTIRRFAQLQQLSRKGFRRRV